MIESNQGKEWVFLEPLVMVHEQMSLVGNVRQAALLEIIANTTNTIWEEPGKHLGEQLWVAINWFWLLTMSNSKDLLVTGQMLERNGLESLCAHVGILFASQSMNNKRALPCLRTLFTLIVMHSSRLRIFVGEGFVVIHWDRRSIFWILIKVSVRDFQIIIIWVVQLQPLQCRSDFVSPD